MKNRAAAQTTIAAYKNRFIQGRGVMTGGNGVSECILFCKKVTPNIFSIKDGFAMMYDADEYVDDGVCMISNLTKVVFVYDEVRQ